MNSTCSVNTTCSAGGLHTPATTITVGVRSCHLRSLSVQVAVSTGCCQSARCSDRKSGLSVGTVCSRGKTQQPALSEANLPLAGSEAIRDRRGLARVPWSQRSVDQRPMVPMFRPDRIPEQTNWIPTPAEPDLRSAMRLPVHRCV